MLCIPSTCANLGFLFHKIFPKSPLPVNCVSSHTKLSQMEESEKRRERLRAMRMEAGADFNSNPCSSSSSSSSSSLSNPLLDRPEDGSNPGTSRFGFYTDPMAAFSFDKRQTGLPNFTSAPHFSPSPSGSKNPVLNSYSPHQAMHQSGNTYYSPSPDCPTSPMPMRTPHPMMQQGSPNFSPAPGRSHWSNSSPSPGSGPVSTPYHVHQGTPNFQSPPGRGHWYNSSPGPSPHPSPGPNPDYGSGWGRGRGYGGSPSVGRGRGRWDGSGMSPGSRYSGGRGRGRGFNTDSRAQSFYNKFMVEDPWESLTPVIWKGVSIGRSNFSHWRSIQNAPVAKKPKASNTFDSSKSKESLADFLTASFDEAAGV